MQKLRKSVGPLIGAVTVLVAGCQIHGAGFFGKSRSALKTWQDVTVSASGARKPCTLSASASARAELCEFSDAKTGLVWTTPLMQDGGRSLQLTWRSAHDYCESLKTPSISGLQRQPELAWRLPSRADYEAAIRDESRQPRADSMIMFGDQQPAFQQLRSSVAYWTDTPEGRDRQRFWGVQRYADQFVFALSTSAAKLPFRCVRTGSAYRGQIATSRSAAPAPKSVSQTRPVPRPTMAVSDDSCRVNPSPEDASHQDSLYYEAVNDALGRSGPSDNLEGDYTPLRLGRAPRAIRESATRTLVVGYLRTAFDKHRFDHHLLAPNGDLQISIGSGFVFGEKSPGVLQEQVQELTKVLREYLRVLAAAASLENRPFRLEVIGYASPSYRGMPQVGYDPSDRGAVYNRVVGMQRAETVVKLMRTLPGADSLTIEALSMGSEGGIVDATGSNSKCGDFDCIASRRVVVRFHADGPGLGVEGDSLLSH